MGRRVSDRRGDLTPALASSPWPRIQVSADAQASAVASEAPPGHPGGAPSPRPTRPHLTNHIAYRPDSADGIKGQRHELWESAQPNREQDVCPHPDMVSPSRILHDTVPAPRLCRWAALMSLNVTR